MTLISNTDMACTVLSSLHCRTCDQHRFVYYGQHTILHNSHIFYPYPSNYGFLFPFLIKYYHILYIIIVFWLGCDRPLGLLLFVPALLLSILTPLFLPPSSVSLSYFILAVPMRECLGKHPCMSSPCPIAILNGTFLFREAK